MIASSCSPAMVTLLNSNVSVCHKVTSYSYSTAIAPKHTIELMGVLIGDIHT